MTKKARKKIKPGDIVDVIKAGEISPGIRTDGQQTVIDAKKVAVLFKGQQLLLADVLQSLTAR